LKDGRGQQCTTELPTSGFAAQTKEGRKIKGSDEKVAVGNDYFGMPFLGNDAESTLQSRQADSTKWSITQVRNTSRS